MRYVLWLFLVFGASTVAPARYAHVETKKVPVERLLKNLSAEPNTPDTLARRARLHAMVYATGGTSLPATSDRANEAWEGYEPPAVPYRPQNAKPTAKSRAHLDEAIAIYREALAADPKNARTRLGLGWCLLEKGDRTAARAELDRAFDGAWESDRAQSDAWRGRMLAEEAADYLRPLLDPTKEKDRLAELDRRVATLQRLPRKVTPILVPLGRETSFEALVDRNARVPFDLDGSGDRCRWPWIRRSAAWLVWDPEGRGRIDSGLQLFGNVTFWLFWNDGYEALCALDDDGDGKLAGKELRHLALWKKDGTVTSLSSAGIDGLRCDRKGLSSTGDVVTHSRGVRFVDGRNAPSYDWAPACLPQ